MIPVPRREHKLLVAIHGWSGIALGLLLFVIVATGTVAVMGEEIGHWSAGTVETRSPLTLPLDRSVKRLFDDVPVTSFKRVDLRPSTANHLRVVFRGDPGPGERGLSVELGPDGTVLRRFAGLMRDMGSADPAGALETFLVDLHVRLYIPEPWGYIVTGIAGLAMMVAAVSGFFIHRHLLTDIFTLRKSGRPTLAKRDRHGVASAWALPFAVVLAFTGSYLSFAGSIGMPALAWVSFGGDQQKLIAAIIGTPPPAQPTPARGADLDAILADATARSGSEPDFVSIAHPGRADAAVTVDHEPRDGELTSVTLAYDGVDGRFVEERPAVGRVPSAGGTAFSLMGPLHFGNFAGSVSKLAWVALGFATCFIIVSGIRLWLDRRGLSGAVWVAIDRATSVVAFGLPLAMATAGIGYFATAVDGDPQRGSVAGFLVGTTAAVASAALLGRPALNRALRVCAGLAIGILPWLRLDAGGPDWSVALLAGQYVIVLGDLALIAIGLAVLAEPLRVWRRSRGLAGRLGPQPSGPR